MLPNLFPAKKNNRIYLIATHPISLSLLASILIILALPFKFPKYNAYIEEQKGDRLNTVLIWEDLLNDCISDLIMTYTNPIGTTALTVKLFPSLKIRQWELRGGTFKNKDAAGEPNHESTGKGLKIMDQFYGLYHKVTGTHIEAEVIDMKDESGNPGIRQGQK